VEAFTYFDEEHTLPADCVVERDDGGFEGFVIDLDKAQHVSLGVFATAEQAAVAVVKFCQDQSWLSDWQPQPWDKPS